MSTADIYQQLQCKHNINKCKQCLDRARWTLTGPVFFVFAVYYFVNLIMKTDPSLYWFWFSSLSLQAHKTTIPFYIIGKSMNSQTRRTNTSCAFAFARTRRKHHTWPGVGRICG